MSLFPAYDDCVDRSEERQAPIATTKRVVSTSNASVVRLDALKAELQAMKRSRKRKREYEDYAIIVSDSDDGEIDDVIILDQENDELPSTSPSIDNEVFKTDKEFNIHQLTHESIAKSKIPKYRLLVRNQTARGKHDRYFSKRNVKRLLHSLLYVPYTPPIAFDDGEEPVQSFIPLKKMTETEKMIDIAKDWKQFDPDERNRDELKRKVVEFNQRLLNDEKNISLWLEFIDFQREFYSSSVDYANLSELKLNELIFDKQMSIFDRAIKANHGNLELEIQRLNYIGSGGILSADQQVSEKWRNLVFKHSNKAHIWWSYLISNITPNSSFRSLSKLFKEAILRLRRVCANDFSTHPPEADTEQELVNIFIAFCQIIRQAGYVEFSFLLLQCQVEFALTCPIPHSVISTKLVEFEKYFDGSNLVSIVRSPGWLQWSKTESKPQHVSYNEMSSNLGISDADDEKIDKMIVEVMKGFTRIWISMETSRSERKLLVDADNEIDTHRVVLFDDVKEFLFPIWSDANRWLLLARYLELHGLNATTALSNFDHAYPFLLRHDRLSLFKTAQESTNTFCCVGLGLHQLAFNRLFSLTAVRNIFSLCCEHLPEPFQTAFIDLYVAFEEQLVDEEDEDGNAKTQAGKRLISIVKSILKKPSHRNNLHLWSLFTRLSRKYVSSSDQIMEMLRSLVSPLKTQADQFGCFIVDNIENYLHFDVNSIDTVEGFVSYSMIGEVNTGGFKLLSSLIFEYFEVEPSPSVGNYLALKQDVVDGEMRDRVLVILGDAADPMNSDQFVRLILLARRDLFRRQILFILAAYLLFGLEYAREYALRHAQWFENCIKQNSSTMHRRPYNRHFCDFALECFHAVIVDICLIDFVRRRSSLSVARDALYDAIVAAPNVISFHWLFAPLADSFYLKKSIFNLLDACRSKITNADAWVVLISRLIEKSFRRSSSESDDRKKSSAVIPFYLSRLFSLFEYLNSHKCLSRSLSIRHLHCAFESKMLSSSSSSNETHRLSLLLYDAIQTCFWYKVFYLEFLKFEEHRITELTSLMTDKDLRLFVLPEEVSILTNELPPDASAQSVAEPP